MIDEHCNFHVGQHVVLVDDSQFRWRMPTKIPVKGVVYTVREVFVGKSGPRGDIMAIRLVEIRNPIRQYIGRTAECGFRASRFRPLAKLTPESFMVMETA